MIRSAFAAALAVVSFSSVSAEPLAVEEVAPGVFVRQGEIALMTAENRGGIAKSGSLSATRPWRSSIRAAAWRTARRCWRQSARGRRCRCATSSTRTAIRITFLATPPLWVKRAWSSSEPRGCRRRWRATATITSPRQRRSSARSFRRPSKIVAPTLLVTETLTLDLGSRALQLQAWPTAHTDGDLTVVDSETRTLFAGDLLFIEHIPALDGSITGWLEVMESLAAIEAERAVPGHGPASAPWPDALDPQRRYLTAVATAVRVMIAEGVSISDAPGLAAVDERPHWTLFDDFHARNVTSAFAELEWE